MNTTPEGFVLVPLEPTESMIRAACLTQSIFMFASYDQWRQHNACGKAERIRMQMIYNYKAMVDAAGEIK